MCCVRDFMYDPWSKFTISFSLMASVHNHSLTHSLPVWATSLPSFDIYIPISTFTAKMLIYGIHRNTLQYIYRPIRYYPFGVTDSPYQFASTEIVRVL